MTKTVSDAIYMVFSLIVFLAAFSLVVYESSGAINNYDELPGSETVYTVNTKIPKEVLWTGAQVVGKLYRISEDDIPIQVDAVVFQTDKDVMDYQTTVHLQANYKQSIDYDNQGNPVKVSFTIQ